MPLDLKITTTPKYSLQVVQLTIMSIRVSHRAYLAQTVALCQLVH